MVVVRRARDRSVVSGDPDRPPACRRDARPQMPAPPPRGNLRASARSGAHRFDRLRDVAGRGSSRTIVRPASFATQTASSLAASASGLAPTGTVARTWFVAGIDPRHRAVEGVRDPDGSLRRTRARSGPLPTPIVCVTPFVFGSRRTTRFWALSPIQIAPPPTAMPRPAAPTSIVFRPAGLRIDPRDRPVVDVRHPDRALTEGDGRRIVADANRLADDVVRVRVDARDGSVERVRDPDVSRAEGDPDRPVADRGSCRRSSCESASMRETLFVSALVTQMASSPAAMRVGAGRPRPRRRSTRSSASTMPTEFALQRRERRSPRTSAEREDRNRDGGGERHRRRRRSRRGRR